MAFETLGLGPGLVRATRDAGYTEPTPIQLKAIPVILKGHDVIGIAQTGTGKTAAFVLPILQILTDRPGSRQTRVLVLVPTRELALQVEENVRKYAKHLPLRCAPIFGGVGEAPQIKALKTHVDIVVATPGRLMDLMNRLGNPFTGLEVVVLDEADRMLDMGFLPDMRRILRQLPTKRQTLLFSATLSKEIESVAKEFQARPEVLAAGKRSAPTHSVSQFVYEIKKAQKLPLLLHLLKDDGLDCVLVFSRTKHGADKLARRLEIEGISTATLHSNRSQSQRQMALKGFKSGRYRVLVATDIAARGIDVDGISHVVNYDFPAAEEDYVHRIGRTGRAHAIGDALSFVTADDRDALRSLERFIGRGIPRRVVEGLKDDVAPPRSAHSESRGDSGRSHSRPQGRSQGSSGGRSQGGYSQGRPAGRSQGSSEGRSSGRTEGRSGNRSEGRSQARPDSRPAPRAEGRSEGRSTARPEGRSHARPETRREGPSGSGTRPREDRASAAPASSPSAQWGRAGRAGKGPNARGGGRRG